jgi:tetratricopeptide (TPR) repeat protein
MSSEEARIEVSELLVKIACEDEAGNKRILLDKAYLTLENALSLDKNNSCLHHLVGLCCYDEPIWTDDIKVRMESSFKKVLEIDETHQFASLYLGHFYFDEKKYDKALPFFSAVRKRFFRKIDQRWRLLKNAELILCCHLYLHYERVTLNEINYVCSIYERFNRVDAPVTTEIVVCLASFSRSVDMKLKAMVCRVLKMIYKMKAEKYFSNFEPFAILRRIISSN